MMGKNYVGDLDVDGWIILSRFMGMTNKRGLDRMVRFFYHSSTITRYHNQLQ
jgi:hypothetical protein